MEEQILATLIKMNERLNTMDRTLGEMKQQIEEEHANLRNEMKQQFEEERVNLRKEMKQQFEEGRMNLRKEIKQQIEEEHVNLRNEIKQQIEEEHVNLRKEIEQQFEEERANLRREIKQQLKKEHTKLKKDMKNEVLDYMFVFENEYGRKVNIVFEEMMAKNQKEEIQNQMIKVLEKRTDVNSAFVQSHENRISALERTKI